MTNHKPTKQEVAKRAAEVAAQRQPRIENLPEKQGPALRGMHVGPLPDAATLTAYRDLDEDLYQMVKGEYKANGESRRRTIDRSQALDEQVVPRLVGLDGRGQVFAFTLGLGALALMAFALYRGNAAGAIGSSIVGGLLALPGLISAFTNRGSNKKDDSK